MNPIDDFFREKLSNHEVKPSDRANQLFLSKLETKKKKKPMPYWYFALAASLFIVLLVGVYYYQGEDDQSSSIALKDADSQLPKKQDVAVTANEKNTKNLALSPNSSLAQDNSQTVKVDKISLNQVTPTTVEVSQNTKTPEVQTIDQKKLDAFFEAENNTKMAIVEEARQNKLEETLIYLTPILALNQVNTFKTNPAIAERGLDDKIVLGEEYFADDKSLLTRVLDEVKHLKKGEKVDFNKLGFKSLEELSLDKEGFIVSETNQIKDRINWIKARLNNN